jgi:hypothetical protein
MVYERLGGMSGWDCDLCQALPYKGWVRQRWGRGVDDWRSTRGEAAVCGGGRADGPPSAGAWNETVPTRGQPTVPTAWFDSRHSSERCVEEQEPDPELTNINLRSPPSTSGRLREGVHYAQRVQTCL